MPPPRPSGQAPASTEPGDRPPALPPPRASLFMPALGSPAALWPLGATMATRRPARPRLARSVARARGPKQARRCAPPTARTRATQGSARAGHGLGCGRARTLAARASNKVEEKLGDVEGAGGKVEDDLGARLGLQVELLHLWGGGWSAGESLSSLRRTSFQRQSRIALRLEPSFLCAGGFEWSEPRT